MGKCIGSTSFFVLINGYYPFGYFGSLRGLRQGGLLSSLLFLLIVVVLGCMLDRIVEVGMLEGFQLNPNGVAISHLQFAYDTFILFANSQQHIRY